jgi:hypothetical protein
MDGERSNRVVGIAIGGLLPLVVAAALVAVRDEVATANLALALVVTVVVAAVAGGWQAGAVAAVVGALSFDFFLTRPYLSLTIDTSADVESTLLLLAVGLIVGTVAARGRRSVESARAGRGEIERIHRLAEMTASGTPAETVIAAARCELTQLLDLADCRFEVPPYATAPPQLERSGAVTGVVEHRLSGREFALPAGGVALAVLVRGHGVGRFVLVPGAPRGISLEERVVAVALVDQVGAAIGGSPPRVLDPRKDRHG